jgi:chemotaxis-related protein WspD
MSDPAGRCWREIGIAGDHSCPELLTHVHCSNCPVYSDAAARFLVRELPEDYRRQKTLETSVARQRGRPHDASAVAFRLGPEWLSLPTSVFAAVGQRCPIHALPHRRGSLVIGLANVRGQLLVCVSLSTVLGIDPSATPTHTGGAAMRARLLVVDSDRGRLAFPVDEVHGVVRYPSESVRELPTIAMNAGARFATGTVAWETRALPLLDHARLFHTINEGLA